MNEATERRKKKERERAEEIKETAGERRGEQRNLEINSDFTVTSFLITPMAMYDHLPAEHYRAGAGCRRACLTVALPGPHPPAVN